MKISVVIPVYNRVSFIGRTLDSILAQTRPVDEIIIVDDGSTDDIEAELRKHPAEVTYIRQANGGPGAARNNGTAHATGDYLLFLDSDDLLEPSALELLEKALDKNPTAAAAFCQATFIDENDNPLEEERKPRSLNDEANGDMWRHLLWGNCIRTTGVAMIRRSHLDQVGEWEELFRINEDWDMWLRLTENGAGFVRLAKPLLRYRVHPTNISGDTGLARRTGLMLYEKHLERHRDNPEKFDAILCSYAACFASYSENAENTEEAAEQEEMAEPWASLWKEYQAKHNVSDPVLVATQDGLDPRLAPRHARLRRLIEKSGAATLYRKTPLSFRLWMRSVFGIEVNA